VATIKPGGNLFRPVSIESVDRYSLGFFDRYAEVLPGYHTVMIQLNNSGANYTKIIQRAVSFVAEAGKVYIVEADETGFFLNKEFWAWIEDEATGARVDGERES